MQHRITFFSSFISAALAIKCMQCTGWSWNYPGNQASPCDNQNAQCNSDQNMCVRITDPMRPGASYETFKLDCWSQSTLQITPGTNQPIVAGQCYSYQDGSNPPKRYKYCFCNNVDYCNGAGNLQVFTAVLLVFVYKLFL
ncbi:unnamed protein product, partial [Mesorhabditis spiculigera]